MSILNTLLGTLSILLFNIVLALAFTGLGLGVRRASGRKRADLCDCFFAFWTGFGVVILFLMLWNFVLPVVPIVLTGVLLSGLTLMAHAIKSKSLSVSKSLPPRWSILLAGIFCVWVANLSTGAMTAWDTSLYHMQGVAWARAHPVVPGLANLFGPLGFNNSSILYNAMLDVGPWSGRAWHVSIGVLVSSFGSQIIMSTGRVFRDGIRKRPEHVLAMLLLPLAVSYALGGTSTLR